MVWSMLTDVGYNLMTPRWFQEMSDRLRFTEQRLLPSWWLSAGLLEASRATSALDETYQPAVSEPAVLFAALGQRALRAPRSGLAGRQTVSVELQPTGQRIHRRPQDRGLVDGSSGSSTFAFSCPGTPVCCWSKSCGCSAAIQCSGCSF